MNMWVLLFVLCAFGVNGKLEDEDEQDSGEHELDESMERIGASVTQVYEYPYAASLIKNDTYVCSAVVLNSHWLLTLSKCFDTGIITTYVTHKNLGNYTVRSGSSYNNKGGTLHKIKMLINNFDQHVTAVKLFKPMEYSSQVLNVRLPEANEDVSLGFLASIIAWTPSGHMRVVNAPVIDTSICEIDTKMVPGHYICLGGVQDPNRHFCRRDNGGAVIQNNTLIAISSFVNTCALYSKTHSFPKISNFVRWLNSVIWDEEQPSTSESTTATTTTQKIQDKSTKLTYNQPYYADPGKFMLTLPFAPINVPLEPAEDNSVLPGMSLYESYLQSMAKPKTSSTVQTTPPVQTTRNVQLNRQQLGSGYNLMYRNVPKKYDRYDYR